MFLKNKNIIFKIRRSKVTDYAALRLRIVCGKAMKTQHHYDDDQEIFFKKIFGCISIVDFFVLLMKGPCQYIV